MIRGEEHLHNAVVFFLKLTLTQDPGLKTHGSRPKTQDLERRIKPQDQEPTPRAEF